MANITLLTDLGLHDASSGIVKGILYSALPGARITDISHEVSPFYLLQAAYVLGGVYSSFPDGCVHLVLVDVHYISAPKLILIASGGQYILAPDNGIATAALGSKSFDAWLCYEHSIDASQESWLRAAAGTIMQLQKSGPAALGLPVYTPARLQQSKSYDGNVATCSILYIDNFGNLVTDMTRERFYELNRNNKFVLSVGVDVIDKMSTTYTDVQKGDPLCRFNSRGYMEICVHRGNASALLGFRVGGIYNDIKITFE